MPNFPTSLDSLPNPGPTTRRNDPGFELDVVVSTLGDAIEAVESKLGIGASVASLNTVLRGTGAGSSAFGQIQVSDLAPGATMSRLGQTVLGAAAASITLSSIPGSYESLLLLVHGRGDQTAQQIELWARVNGDAAGNYLTAEQGVQGSTAFNAELISTKWRIGFLPGATATGSLFGAAQLVIPGYARAVGLKAALAEGAEAHTFTTGGFLRTHAACFWVGSTAALTSLTLLPSVGNLIAGTVATLYGLPA